jgi:hypothetical protein
MKLTSEELPEILEVTEADIEQVFEDEVFGKFIILSATEDHFIQAACVWSPECDSFLERTGSDPYRLEYRDGGSGKMFAASENLTLDQIKAAFLDYLRGGNDWRCKHSWVEFSL